MDRARAPDLTKSIPDTPSCRTLREMREALGLSQRELAEAIGLGKQNGSGERIVRSWEHDPACIPSGAAWHAIRYLTAVAGLYRSMDHESLTGITIRALLPESLR